MSEPFMGQITIYPFNFAPSQWAFCQAQLMSISQNSALFALLGTTYGGDGVTTFALPDLRGRFPLGTGNSPQFGSFQLGQMAGTQNVSLTNTNLPTHNHVATFTGTGGGGAPVPPTITINVSADPATAAAAPAGGYLSTSKAAGPGVVTNIYAATATAGTTALNAATAVATGGSGGGITGGTVAVQPAGQSLPFSVTNPYLALNFCIALTGIFPTRG